MVTKKAYTPKTEEQRQQEVEALSIALQEGVLNATTSPEKFKAYLETMALFPQYSFKNVSLIYAQKRNATFVASFKRFKELNRNVKKGEKAIRILAPRFKNVINEKTGAEESVCIGFLAVPVFDVSQTEGEPLPIEAFKLTLEGESEEAERIFEATAYLAEQDDCKFNVGYANGANGYYSPAAHAIVVSENLGGNHRAKTAVHELVHSRVHRANNGTPEEQESVAEGAAFVVCSYFGLDTSSYSFEYIHGWSKTPESIFKYCEQIQEIAVTLIQQYEEYLSLQEGEEQYVKANEQIA